MSEDIKAVASKPKTKSKLSSTKWMVAMTVITAALGNAVTQMKIGAVELIVAGGLAAVYILAETALDLAGMRKE